MSPDQDTIIEYDKKLPYIEGKQPYEIPNCYLEKDGENSYKVIEGRRPSKRLLIEKLREAVNGWRDDDYSGVSNTTRQLFKFWFENDHIKDGELFNYWFCQREAIETLVYLYEIKDYKDLKSVVEEYGTNYMENLFSKEIEFSEDREGKRKILRYFPDLEQIGEQDFPEENLLKYAFKMATGSGKTMVMAMVCVWSYFNKVREGDLKCSDNFLIIAPNVIVYERLEKDFQDNKIFYDFPLIPKPWRGQWNLKVTLRGDDAPLNTNGNIIVNNIHQIYESRKNDWTPENVVEAILGQSPQKDLTKPPIYLLDQLKQLSNLIIMNDEAHHAHDEELQWNRSLNSIHESIPGGLNLWLDFSATPKFQSGSYYPWIIVDYPLAQAVEDRIVKIPLIVSRINREDPEHVIANNVIQKYGDWLDVALVRWKEHYEHYQDVGKKPVLFIMTEKIAYARRIGEEIKNDANRYGLEDPEEEVLIIHTDSHGNINEQVTSPGAKKKLDDLRKTARNIDSPGNKVKIVVSVLMLKEGWDVQNVTIVLGLRAFDSPILPEQTVGRGLRLMSGIGPETTQTIEVIGTKKFEEFVKKLETEGVGINVVNDPPPLPVTIAPESSREEYDIIIPKTEFRFTREYNNISKIDVEDLPSIFESEKLKGARKEKFISIRELFTDIEVDKTAVDIQPRMGREIIAVLTKEVNSKARLNCSFKELYFLVKEYVLKRCFDVEIENLEHINLRHFFDSSKRNRDTVSEFLAYEIGERCSTSKETVRLKNSYSLYRDTQPSKWRRKHIRLDKTVFNFVAVYNDFEKRFAEFLDRARDIKKFTALATTTFRIDYLSTKGAIRFYHPDFVAVQAKEEGNVFWIVETKGREYSEVERKDASIKKWCRDVSDQNEQEWNYIRVPQKVFDKLEDKINVFEALLKNITDAEATELQV